MVSRSAVTKTKLTEANSNNSNKYSEEEDKASKQGVIERIFPLKQLS